MKEQNESEDRRLDAARARNECCRSWPRFSSVSPTPWARAGRRGSDDSGTLDAVAIQTIHLADDPRRFRHKMGEKVVVQGTDGYADPDYAAMSCATRFGRRSGRTRCRGRCPRSRQATWKEERPCGRHGAEASARSAATESGRVSRVPSSMSTRIGACIDSTTNATRSG